MISLITDMWLIKFTTTLGALYAKAPIFELGTNEFEPVTDSSRYFVVKLRSLPNKSFLGNFLNFLDDAGQSAFVGIGFADRSDSFDLSVALQDHFKSVKKSEENAKNEANTPKLDLGFKEGQTITVNIGSVGQFLCDQYAELELQGAVEVRCF